MSHQIFHVSMNLHEENTCSWVSTRQMELLDVEERMACLVTPKFTMLVLASTSTLGELDTVSGNQGLTLYFPVSCWVTWGQVSFCRCVLTNFVSKIRSPFNLARLKGAKQERALMFWTRARSSSARHPSQNHIPKFSLSTETAWHFLPANSNLWNPKCLAVLSRWHTQSE